MTIMYEVRQKISNHPVLDDLEREIVVYRVADNMDVKQMPISARIQHFKDVECVITLLPELTRDIKDWVVADNKGLHFALAYIWFDIIYLLNIHTAFISTIFFIVLMEIIDKKKIKTKFSLIDVVSGIIGMILSYVINTI